MRIAEGLFGEIANRSMGIVSLRADPSCGDIGSAAGIQAADRHFVVTNLPPPPPDTDTLQALSHCT